MNLSMKQTHREQTYGCLGRGKVVMEGRIGSLGLADANFFFPHTHSMCKFLGQGWKLCHSSDPSHCRDIIRSLTH